MGYVLFFLITFKSFSTDVCVYFYQAIDVKSEGNVTGRQVQAHTVTEYFENTEI